MPKSDIEILKRILNDSRDGISISDCTLPDNPLIFVNPAFERMTGYSLEECVGQNCRFLQGSDKVQETQLKVIREAIKSQQSCLVTLKNYRKDGVMFWNELSISPIFDEKGKLTQYLGIQKDITSQVIIQEQISLEFDQLKKSNSLLEYLTNIDPLTGIYNRRYFDKQLLTQWEIAKREKQLLTVFMIDIDHFKIYNDLYGHQAGDEALKNIAKVLNSSFLRTTDFVARYGGEEFIILSIGGTSAYIEKFALSIIEKILDLKIPHRGSEKKFVSTSLGFAYCEPQAGDDGFALVKQADDALYKAKLAGRSQAIKFSVEV